MNRFQTLRLLAKTQGWGWVGYRAYHALLHKTGALQRRLPAIAWDELRPQDLYTDPAIAEPDRLAAQRDAQPARFLFDPTDRERYRDLLLGFDGEDDDPRAILDQLQRGELSYFSNPPISVGFPPRWNDNLPENKPGPARVHFSKLDEFASGDVKCIWEPSRFGFAYTLVRCYWRTGDERAPELFWQAAEDWVKHNPPNTGINWKCGQESTFRAMAWCFALWGFADSPATTDERVAMAVKLMAVTARRVEQHLRYALSQKNNHGVSEAMGLFTLGLLFPELRGAERWVETGEKYLESQARELIYDDGAFSQHAANYHRVMLHDLLYAIRLGELNGRPLSKTLVERVAQAGRFLFEIEDSVTGRVPRYGQDDGALILPLSNQAYDDFRPVAQSAAAVTGDGALPWPNGPWDEEALWLCGPDALERDVPPPLPVGRASRPSDPSTAETAVPPRAPTFTAPDGGCHLLRGKDGMAFMRAQHYHRHGPTQLDQLHTDLWWRGINVALDPGTYCYNATGKWEGVQLMWAGAHNTVAVDNEEPAEAVTRFKFAPWPQARGEVWPASSGGAVRAVCATSDAYRFAGVIEQKRWVFELGGTHWLILDSLVGDGDPLHFFRLNWNLADATHDWDECAGRLDLHYGPGGYRVAVGAVGAECTADLARADERTSRGWYAPRYMAAEPCLSLTAEADAPAVLFYSVFGPGDWSVDATGDRLTLTAESWSATLKHYLQTPQTLTMAGSIADEWKGPPTDRHG